MALLDGQSLSAEATPRSKFFFLYIVSTLLTCFLDIRLSFQRAEGSRQALESNLRVLEEAQAAVDISRARFMEDAEDLRVSMADPVTSLLTIAAQDETEKVLSYKDFSLLASFCNWDSPINFAIPDTQSDRTLYEWISTLKKAKRSKASTSQDQDEDAGESSAAAGADTS
jgi:hypothetical protein